MRTIAELLDDLARLEGARLDDTVFELVHRGSRSLDRLSSFAAASSPDLAQKIESSIVRQWSRIQEIIANLEFSAFSSAGVKYALAVGPADAIARRAIKCVARGEFETAACLAAAIPDGDGQFFDRSELEALLAVASGRPDKAMALLEPYLAPGPLSKRALPVYSRAALSAGEFGAAYSELQVEAMEGMIMAFDCPAAAECVRKIATSGDVLGWEQLAEGFVEAVEVIKCKQTQALARVSDPVGAVADGISAASCVLDDLQTASSEWAIQSLERELRACSDDLLSVIAEARLVLERFVSAGSSLVDSITESVLMLGFQRSGSEGEWIRPVQGFEAAHGECMELPDVLSVAAALVPLSVRCYWRGGNEVLRMSAIELPSEEGEIELDVGRVLSVLKGSVPEKASLKLLSIARKSLAAHCRTTALVGIEHMELIRADFEGLDTSARYRERVSSAVEAHRSWGALIKGEEHVHHEEEEPVAEESFSTEGAYSAQACQAMRTAHMLIEAKRMGELPPEQAELPGFLLGKAIQAELEEGYGEALAPYRLRPALLKMTRERGKRRRELDPRVLETARAFLPTGVEPERIRSGFERLCSIVLDGADRRISADPLLAGLAFGCLETLSDSDLGMQLGRALVRFAVALQGAGPQARVDDLAELENSACDALALLCCRKAE